MGPLPARPNVDSRGTVITVVASAIRTIIE
jgi:hypothetical protein